MKTRLVPFCAAALAARAAFATVIFDPAARSVSFTATSTDCGLDAQLEFLVVGPDSDRDYEAMFVADDPVSDIADAFDRAGIPRGVPFNPADCIFWPEGAKVECEPSFSSLVREMRGETTPDIVYTGGSRDSRGTPEAATNMPSAVFALYNCSQSLLQLDDSLDQSPVYGRFSPAVKIPKGEKRTFVFKWNGKTDCRRIVLPIAPGGLEQAVLKLRDESSRSAVSVTPDFSPELTLDEAGKAAQMLSMVDSPRVKINGTKDSQLYYRAYEPLEKWRERKERLSQPPEVRFLADGKIKVVEIIEDWSDPDSLDPKLSTREFESGTVAEAAAKVAPLAEKTSTVLVFAPAGDKIGKFAELKKLSGKGISTWYVFKE